MFNKVFFFTSLVVAALIATLTFLNFTSDWFANMLTNISDASHGEIPAVVVAFFPIVTTTLCALFALIVSTPIHFICKKKTALSKKTKFFLYYFLALAVTSILVLHACLLSLDISKLYIATEVVGIVGLHYGACVAEALVLAAFLVSFFTLWKTNRLVASIIGVIILLIIPANYISGWAIYEASSLYYDSEYTGYSNNDDTLSMEEYSADSETLNDYPDDVEDDYLSFLWGEGEYGISDAANVLFGYDISTWDSEYTSHLLSDVSWTLINLQDNSTSSYFDSIPNESEKRVCLNMVYHYLIDNPAEAINALVSYRQILYHYMPVEKFYGTAAYKLLSYLSEAHQDLYGDENLNRLQNIYKLMSNIEHDFASEYYDDINLHINDSHKSIFYDEGELDKDGTVWAYSFWARRNAEGTDDIAYSILNMLQDYYSEAEYYQNYVEEEAAVADEPADED